MHPTPSRIGVLIGTLARIAQSEKARIAYSGTEVAPLTFGGNVFGRTADQRPSDCSMPWSRPD